MKNTKKIGILTFHRIPNYGAILQSYALQTEISQFQNLEVKVIDYTPDKFKRIFHNPYRISSKLSLRGKIKCIFRWILKYKTAKRGAQKYSALQKFIEDKLNLTNVVSKSDLVKLNEWIDIFIVGSDQVWKCESTDYDESYFLDFVDKIKKKISYAASLKIDNDRRAEELFHKWLPSFDAISVREQNAVAYLKNKFNINSNCVLDPTFLLDNRAWLELIDGKYKRYSAKYILIYTVGLQERLLEYAFKYAKEHSLKIISLNHIKGRIDYTDFSNATVEQFIGLINDAECVFTTSFHGLAFSINLHTSFYFEVSEQSKNNNERLFSISQQLGLLDRNISNGITDVPIDWNAVEMRLNALRNESVDFLKSAIGLDDNES